VPRYSVRMTEEGQNPVATVPEADRVAVLGAGGIGGLLAAVLARAGSSVEVLASESTARVILERGLRVESQRFGDFQVAVRSSLRLESPVGVCFVAVKNTQLREALERVPSTAIGEGLVMPFLNGIEHVDLLRSIYPPSSVVAATFRVEAAKVEPGVIRQSSPFASINIAASDANRARVERVATQLRAAGLDVRVRDDETLMLWEKLCFLVALALVTTHERANAGEVRSRRRDDTLAVIAEAAAVAAAEGAAIDPEAVTHFLDSVPATMESSMQRDRAAGRPLEIDAIGGAVVRRAARVGVDVPVTARLVAELRSGSSMGTTT
jgi:2-dehydropantoate 2-reductase